MCGCRSGDEDRLVANYDVAGLGLRVGADSPELLADAHRLLSRFESPTPGSWRVDIQRGDPSAAPCPASLLRCVWEGDVPPDLRGVNYVGPGLRRLELCDHGRLDLDLNARRAAITLASAAKPSVVGYFLVPLLCEGLARVGFSTLHAACLAAPAGNRWRAALIVAPSGTGKTTTALALAQDGWKLMGDDITLIGRQQGRLGVWGFPRICHVRRPTLRLLPWLGGLPLAALAIEDAFRLRVEDLGSRAWLGPPEPLEPLLIVCLDPPNPDGHHVAPLDRAAALIQLSQENVQPIEGPCDAAAQGAFATLAELLQRAPACRLSAGPGLDTLASFLSRHLGKGIG